MAKGGSSKIKTGGMIAATTVVLAALVTGLVFATTALFTDEGTVTGRITAGDMQIGLYETGTQTAELDKNTGYIKVGEYQDESSDPVDLLDTSEGYYTLFTMENAIPGVYTAKTIMVDGSKSDVAFSSVLTITGPVHYGSGNTEDTTLTTEDNALAEHIKITVYSGTGSSTDAELGSFMLDKCDESSVTLGDCTPGGSLTFTIKAEFDTTNGVSAESIRGASISFDINITATQKESN